MNRDLHQPTRTDTIAKHVSDYVREKSKREEFAARVVEKYEELVPNDKDRCIEFKKIGKPSTILATNAQRVFRWFDKDIAARLPADLEEAVVLSLPEPYLSRCRTELAARYGLLAALIPQGAAGHADIARLLKETADVVNVLGQMYEDGKLDANDAKHKPTAIKEINDAIGALLTLRGRIEKEVEDEPKLKAVK